MNTNLSTKNPKIGQEVVYLNETNLSTNSLILICEVQYSDVVLRYVEGTFTFVNQQWVSTYDASSYYNYTVDVHMDAHNASISLFSSNNTKFKPVIVKYTNSEDDTDIKYYFALILLKSHNWNRVYFNGITNVDILKTYINYSSTFPDGYEIYQEANPMRKLNLVSGYIGNSSNSYSYSDIKTLYEKNQQATGTVSPGNWYRIASLDISSAATLATLSELYTGNRYNVNNPTFTGIKIIYTLDKQKLIQIIGVSSVNSYIVNTKYRLYKDSSKAYIDILGGGGSSGGNPLDVYIKNIVNPISSKNWNVMTPTQVDTDLDETVYTLLDSITITTDY